MKKIRTIVVEDEKRNMDLLLHFLKKYCRNIEVVATCATFENALSTLNSIEVDLVFLKFY